MSDLDLSFGENGADTADDVDIGLLEKRLENLRDTQESIQGLSLWCQTNKRHSQIITEAWLKILKKSPVEKRLTMFYLANDVVQHAKRKSDVATVNHWAFTVQKATPLVRSPSSVSTAIIRIFKIWEERNIYSKDTVADLLRLLHNSSAKERPERKGRETYSASADKVAAFQPSQLISKVKLASRLKSHLGNTFKSKPYVQMTQEILRNSIKDRQHGQEMIQEMGSLGELLRVSETKLQNEVDQRRAIKEVGEIAIVHYENLRVESNVVNAAYKNFTSRIMKARETVLVKLKSFEDMEREPSPCPSPPASAPSPVDNDFATPYARRKRLSSDSDIEIIPFPSASNASSSGYASQTSFQSDIIEEIPMPSYDPVSQQHQPPIPTAAPPPPPAYDPMVMGLQMQNWSNIMMGFPQQASTMNSAPAFMAPNMPQFQMSMPNLSVHGYPDPMPVPAQMQPPAPPNNPPPPPDVHSGYPLMPQQSMDSSIAPPPPNSYRMDPPSQQESSHMSYGDIHLQQNNTYIPQREDYGAPHHDQHPNPFGYTQQPNQEPQYNTDTGIPPPPQHLYPMEHGDYGPYEPPSPNRNPEDRQAEYEFQFEEAYNPGQFSPPKSQTFTPSRGRRGNFARSPAQRTLQALTPTKDGPPGFPSRRGGHQGPRVPRGGGMANQKNANMVPLGKPPPNTMQQSAGGRGIAPLLSLAGYDPSPISAPVNGRESGGPDPRPLFPDDGSPRPRGGFRGNYSAGPRGHRLSGPRRGRY